jgi:hypothetical protein
VVKDKKLKDKIIRQKELNEQQLLESKIKKEGEMVKQKKSEKEQVEKLN